MEPVISPTPSANPADARQRTFAWSDPAELARAGTQLAGLDFLRAVQAGTLPLPPVMALLGMQLDPPAEGRVVMRLQPAEFHYNPIGSVHGGVLATLLDAVMGCAVHSLMPMGRGYTTLEFKVSFVRAVRVGTREIVAEGKIVHLGRQTALAEGTVRDRRERVVAMASTTCLLFDLPGQRETSAEARSDARVPKQ